MSSGVHNIILIVSGKLHLKETSFSIYPEGYGCDNKGISESFLSSLELQCLHGDFANNMINQTLDVFCDHSSISYV